MSRADKTVRWWTTERIPQDAGVWLPSPEVSEAFGLPPPAARTTLRPSPSAAALLGTHVRLVQVPPPAIAEPVGLRHGVGSAVRTARCGQDGFWQLARRAARLRPHRYGCRVG